jgi:hypothetical protein
VPKRPVRNRIAIVVENGVIQEIVADEPRKIEVTIIESPCRDWKFAAVTIAPDGEKAYVNDYPVGSLNADHDKWLLSDKTIGV